MNSFAYRGRAEVKHVNIRKEGPDDEKILAIDVKFACLVRANIGVNPMLEFFHEGLSAAIYTDIGAVKNTQMKPLVFDNKIRHCDLDVLGHTYADVDVAKISLEPVDGWAVRLVFSVSLQPSGNEVGCLAEYVADDIDIHIRPQPELEFGKVVAEEVADAAIEEARRKANARKP